MMVGSVRIGKPRLLGDGGVVSDRSVWAAMAGCGGRSPEAARSPPASWIRSGRLDGGLFKFAEFVAHDSRLQVQELKSRPGRQHQPARTLRRQPLMPHFGFRGIGDMARPATELEPGRE